ncbi:MAG TPA: RNA 2',3'-cyclic phosphodiesterase [Gemmatimonadales bacterium]
MSLRLFIAVNLPAEERRAAWDATAPLRTGAAPVKWVAEENLHVTMRFLGPVEEIQAAEIGALLAQSVRGLKPFDVGLGGCGAFPDQGNPKVLWIGVEKHPALELLANDVERVVSRFGFEPELRPFQPHVTIGRARKDAPRDGLREVVEQLGRVDYASVVPVESVDLMESRTSGNGPGYRVVQRATLGGGA